MKKMLTAVRFFLLILAVTITAVSFVPDRTTAEVMMGPCLDDGCPGGDSFCDYVEIGGEWRPCNLGAALEDQ